MQASEETLNTFHSDEYIDLIKKVTPDNRSAFEDQLYRFNFKDDCPVMERLYDYCLSYTTGSVGTSALNSSVFPAGRGQAPVWHKLVRGSASRQAIGGIWLLLCQWLCASHPGDAQNIPEGLVHWHRYSPRGWSRGGFLHHRSGYDLLFP